MGINCYGFVLNSLVVSKTDYSRSEIALSVVEVVPEELVELVCVAMTFAVYEPILPLSLEEGTEKEIPVDL